MAVYSQDRVNRLRMVLGIVIAIAVLTAVLAAFILANGDHRAAGVLAMVVAGLLLGAGGSALKLLGDAGRPAKIATVVTGVALPAVRAGAGRLLAGVPAAAAGPRTALPRADLRRGRTS